MIKEITTEDKLYNWKKVSVHCYSLLYDNCTKFPICPICPKYCFHYSTEPIKDVAIAYYNGTCNIRELAK